MDSTSRFPLPIVDPTETGGRAKGRDSLFLMAGLTLEAGKPPIDVRVRNLSAGGLMVELDRLVAGGTPVVLALRGLGDVAGRVVWCAEGRIGVAFDRPIDPMRARKPVGKGKATPVFAKPMLGTPRG